MPTKEQKRKKRKKTLKLLGVLAGLMIAVYIFFSLSPPAATPQPTASPTMELYVCDPCPTCEVCEVCPAKMPVPASTPTYVHQSATVPILTPRPTKTPLPTKIPTPLVPKTAEPTPIPTVVEVLEAVFAPGTYIVGKDLPPGTYQGQAGTGILGSCYWARLSGLSGELGDILANDNATGQFYIEVKESDFALETACRIERMSN